MLNLFPDSPSKPQTWFTSPGTNLSTGNVRMLVIFLHYCWRSDKSPLLTFFVHTRWWFALTSVPISFIVCKCLISLKRMFVVIEFECKYEIFIRSGSWLYSNWVATELTKLFSWLHNLLKTLEIADIWIREWRLFSGNSSHETCWWYFLSSAESFNQRKLSWIIEVD